MPVGERIFELRTVRPCPGVPDRTRLLCPGRLVLSGDTLSALTLSIPCPRRRGQGDACVPKKWKGASRRVWQWESPANGEVRLSILPESGPSLETSISDPQGRGLHQGQPEGREPPVGKEGGGIQLPGSGPKTCGLFLVFVFGWLWSFAE